MSRFSFFWWRLVPAAVARASPGLAAAMVDGLYLPQTGRSVAAPAFAFSCGFAVGALHVGFRDVFTESLMLMAVLLTLGTVTSGIAAWASSGIAIGDSVVSVSKIFIQADTNLQTSFLKLGSLIIIYLLLLSLTVFIPQFSRRLAAMMPLPTWLKRQRLTAAATMVAVTSISTSMMVWVWVRSTPLLIRPAFTWFNQQPTTIVMETLQQDGMTLVALATIGCCSRFVLQQFVPSCRVPPLDISPVRLTIQESLRRIQRRPVWLRLGVRTLLTTLMLSGMLETWVDITIIVLVQVLYHWIRHDIRGRVPHLVKIIELVPLPIRLGVWLLCTYQVAAIILGFYWNSSDTFRPIVLSVSCSMIVFSVLFPIQDSHLIVQ